MIDRAFVLLHYRWHLKRTKVIIVVFEYGIEIQAVIKYHDFRYPSQIVNRCFPYFFTPRHIPIIFLKGQK